MPDTKTTTRPTSSRRPSNVWTDEERAAMREGARERKTSSRRDPAAERAEGERDLKAKIAEMPEPDRGMAERIHEIVSSAAPDLAPRTYYGMPAYSRDGKTICFFKPKSKFKERYATFGFETNAPLDEGEMWPVAFAVNELTPAVERRIAELVKKAAG
jgi:uncharacterized protein YdhG (YjbR/CyaY superfamily)